MFVGVAAVRRSANQRELGRRRPDRSGSQIRRATREPWLGQKWTALILAVHLTDPTAQAPLLLIFVKSFVLCSFADMDVTDVEIGKDDKMEVDSLTSKEIQDKQQEDTHLEAQNCGKAEKDQKSIDIVTNSGAHTNILGEKIDSKYTAESRNIFGEKLIEKEKNLGKSPQTCAILPCGGGADQMGLGENKVVDAFKNATPETGNKRSTSHPAANQVEPMTPVASETFKVQVGDTTDIKVIY